METKKKVIIGVSIFIVLIMVVPVFLVAIGGNSSEEETPAPVANITLDCPDMIERTTLLRDIQEWLGFPLRTYRWETPVAATEYSEGFVKCLAVLTTSQTSRFYTYTICTENYQKYAFSIDDNTEDCYNALSA